MNQVAKIAMVVCVLGVCAANGQVPLKDLLRPVVRLKGDGAETVINCPWEKKLSVSLSEEAPAAVVKCIDGGLGIDLDFHGH
jgi:hypothetical protein